MIRSCSVALKVTSNVNQNIYFSLNPSLLSKSRMENFEKKTSVLSCEIHSLQDEFPVDQVKSKYEDDPRMKRRPVIINKKIYNTRNLSLNVFRELDTRYNFVKLSPPSVNIDMHQVSGAFWMSYASQTNDKHDLLEAWHLLASSNNMNFESYQEVQDMIVHKLMENLSDYNYSQLADLLFNLRILYEDQTKLNHFIKMLDEHLTKKLKQILFKKSPSKEELDLCLKVGLSWLRAEMEQFQHHLTMDKLYTKSPKIRGKHNIILTHLLFTKHLEILSPEQLVFGLFLCSVLKKYPGCVPKFSKGQQGFPIPEPLYQKLAQVLPKLTPVEVGILCNSLHQAHLYLETKHSSLRQRALHCLVNYDEKRVVRDQFIVGSLAKFLKNRGSENHQHSMKVIKKYQDHLQHLSPSTNIRLLQFLLPGKPFPEESSAFLQKLSGALEPHLHNVRLKDLEILSFGLYFLNQKEVIDKMKDKISDAVMKCDWGSEKSGRSFVYLTQLLAKMGKFDIQSINQIMVLANQSQMDNLDTKKGLSTAVDFLYHLNIPFVKKNSEKHSLKFIDSHRFLMRGTLFCLLQLDSLREIYNVDCVKLRPDLRKTLTEYFHNLPENEIFSTEEQYLDHEGKISTDSFNKTTKGFILRDLNVIFGDKKFLWTGHPFPHSTSSIIILIKDSRGNFVPIPPDFQTFTHERIVSRCGEDGFEYHAILIPSKGQQDFKGNIFGPLASNIEQLKILGYSTTVIFWAQYFRAFKSKNNLNFLRNLLNIRINRRNNKG